MRTLLAASLLAAALLPSRASAGGLFLTDRGARPLSRGFALVAGADDPQAIWYNPAGLSWSGQQLLFDATLTFLRASYERVDGGGNVLPSVDANAAPLPIPMLAYSHPINDWTIGLGLFAPNASLLRWPRGVRADGGSCDFTGDDADDPGCQPAPQRYSLYSLEGSAFVNVSPAVAWQPIEGFSVGLGMHLLVGSFVGETAISSCDGFVCSQPENPEWDGLARFELSPIIHPGLSGGLTYDAGVVRVGASFAWWPKAVSGDARLQVRLPSAPLFDGARVEGDKARLELALPFMLRGGVELRPTRGLRIEAALVWEHWATQRAAKITPKDVWIRDAVAIGDYQVGPIDIPRRMNDVYSVRLGGSYRFADRVEVSLGVNYENSSFDDAYLTPLTLDSSKWITALGVSVQVTEGVWFDVSYAHVFLQDRNVTTSQVPQPNPIRPPRNPDVPPTAGGTVFVGNGRYDMEADVVGVGLRWQIDAPSHSSGAAEEGSPGDEPTAEPTAEAEPPPARPDPTEPPAAPRSPDACGPEGDAEACALLGGEAVVVAGVTFVGVSLAPESEPALQRLLALLERHPELRVEIGAHTDSRGGDAHNLRISRLRAEAVVNWLAERGVALERLEVRGYGERYPIAPNTTAEGRARNRRIEVRRLD